MLQQTGKIPELANKIITGLSCSIAISIALARILVRLHINRDLPISKKLQLDDWLLLFACATLIAASVLLLYALPTVYLIQVTSFNPTGLFGSGGAGITDLDTLLVKIKFFARFNWIYLILSWTTIFAVKFGFLSFFRSLVLRLPNLYTYWRVVVGVTTIVYLFSLIDGVVACPHDDLIALSCSVDYARKIGAIAIALDIMTDLMILAIPVNILWRVKMQMEQKLGLAIFLCLQVLMIVIAVIRISGFIYHNAFDEGWVYMWQQIEACVSVSCISLTAFRVMFVANSSRREHSPWWSSKRAWREKFLKKSSQATSTGDIDVSIPGATITGLRTAIGGPRTENGNDTTVFSVFDEDVEEWPLRPLPARVPPARPRNVEPARRLSLPRFGTDESYWRMSLGRFQRIN